MKHSLHRPAALAILALTGCWQLHEQESVRPHEQPALAPPQGSVAVDDVIEELANPFSIDDGQVVYEGHLNYRRFCWQCHGDDLSGFKSEEAIAGQAFPHLRRSLLDASIQNRSDAEMFTAISEWSGEPRYSCPPMGATMTEERIWETVIYLRAVAAGQAEVGVPEGFRYGAVPAQQARLPRYRITGARQDISEVIAVD
jgi:mono/diheme cytochrome c family protein